MIGVYKIEVNNKCYVGSSGYSIKNRWRQHLSQLRRGVHGNAHLQNAYNKHGEESLKFSILEVVETPQNAIIIEQLYIDNLKPEYNKRAIAESNRGNKLSDETKKKMSMSKMGHVISEETKRKIGEANKISQLGNKHTDITKQKMGIAHAGHSVSEETRKRMSENHNRSEETRKKKSEARIGKTTSEETRKKLSEANLGKKYKKRIKQNPYNTG
jgi:group I intron endonuclease